MQVSGGYKNLLPKPNFDVPWIGNPNSGLSFVTDLEGATFLPPGLRADLLNLSAQQGLEQGCIVLAYHWVIFLCHFRKQTIIDIYLELSI